MQTTGERRTENVGQASCLSRRRCNEGGPVSIISFSDRRQMRQRLFKADSSPLVATSTCSDLMPPGGEGQPCTSGFDLHQFVFIRVDSCRHVVHRLPKTKYYQTNPNQKIRFACKQRRKFTTSYQTLDQKRTHFQACAPPMTPNPKKISRHYAGADAKLLFRREIPF